MSQTEDDLASQLAINAAAYLEATHWWDDQGRRWHADRPDRIARPDEVALTRHGQDGAEETMVVRIEAMVVPRADTTTDTRHH